MSWRIFVDTADNMAEQNYKIYDGKGTELVKYGKVESVAKAKAGDGLMFDMDNSWYIYEKKNDATLYKTQYSFIVNDDKTVITFSGDNAARGQVTGWTNWKGLDLKTVPLAEVEPPEPEKTRTLTDAELTTFTKQGLKVKVDGEIADSSTEYAESAVITIHSPDMRDIVETAGYPLKRVDNINYDDWMGTGNDYDAMGNAKYSDIYVTITDWYDLDLSTLNIKLYRKPSTFTQDLIDHYRQKNLTLSINDEVVNSDDNYSTSDRLDIIADDGFTIVDVQSYIQDEFLNFVDPPIIENDSKSAYIKDYEVEWLDKFVWDIDEPVVVDPDLPDEGGQTGQTTRGALEVYSMNPDDVRQFTTDFHGLVFKGQTTVVDYSQYILNLITLPFTLQDSLIQESDVNVKLGDKKTKYKADRLKIDTLNYNVGEISVPNEYDNLLDIANTTTILHLPFITPIVLETQYVVGYTIQVEFVINLTNSDCDINVRTSGLDEGNGFGLITSTAVNLNTQIPWGRADDYVPTNDPSDLGIVTDNGVKQAYIELIRNKPTNIDGLWTIPVTDDAELSTSSGYIEVTNIDLISSAPRNEKYQIIKMLEDGIIIK